MIKKYFCVELLTFIFATVFVSFIKVDDYNLLSYTTAEFWYKLLISFDEDFISNFIWLIPILYMLFFVSKTTYIRIMNFNNRYKNRRQYINSCIKEFILFSVFVSLIFIIITFGFACFKYSDYLIFDFNIFAICLKFTFEIMLFELLIVVLAIFIKNYTYSYLVLVFVFIICIMFFKKKWIPIVSIFADYQFNYWSFISFVLFYFLLRKVYLCLDIGGDYK